MKTTFVTNLIRTLSLHFMNTTGPVGGVHQGLPKDHPRQGPGESWTDQVWYKCYFLWTCTMIPRARLLGASAATAQVTTFLDSHCECSQVHGWVDARLWCLIIIKFWMWHLQKCHQLALLALLNQLQRITCLGILGLAGTPFGQNRPKQHHSGNFTYFAKKSVIFSRTISFINFYRFVQ